MAWHWVYTKGCVFLNVWGGRSHWSAEEEGEVVYVMRKEEWFERERVSLEPFIGSSLLEREKGIGVLLD